MADEKVYGPSEIADNPLPQDTTPVTTPASQPTSHDVITPKTIPDQPLPTRMIAHEVIGEVLNTKSKKILAEFGFTKMGAIQIGQQQDGISGDIRISPIGIVGRNPAGVVTFSIDADTGDAVFAGEVQAGSFISGEVSVGDGSVIIDGDSSSINIFDSNSKNLIRLNETGLIGFNIAGDEIMHLKTTGLELYGDAGSIFTLFDSNGGTKWGKLGYNVSAGFSHSIDLSARGVMYLTAYESDGDFVVLKSYIQLNDGSDLGNSVIYAKNDLNVNTGGVFKVNGSTKTAIVNTSDGYKALYCVESPEVWFFDFAQDKDSIDPLFIEATEGPIKTVRTEEGELLVFRRRKGFLETRFEAKTFEEFERNNRFWQTPTVQDR